MAPFSSPKRKRYPPAVATIPPTPPSSSPAPEMRVNTNIPGVVIESEDGRQGSPRTKVAYNFQGLQLDDPGELHVPARLDFDTSVRSGVSNKIVPRDERGLGDSAGGSDEDSVRKRVKVLTGRRRLSGRAEGEDIEREVPETPQVSGKPGARERQFTISIGPERTVDSAIVESARSVILSNEVDPVIFKGSSHTKSKDASALSRAFPSIDRRSDSKSRAKKSAKAPHLFGSAEASLTAMDDSNETTTVDLDRSALTWHDDEITGHNPDDPDDDGEGINGIGFKPTAEEAYARAQKRRQQMLEYRNREARDARRMRGERRRKNEAVRASQEEQDTARRVRFLEAESHSVISTS